MSRFKVRDSQDGCTKCPKIEGVRGKKVYEYFADGSDDMEHKIGEIVTLLDGRKVEVVEIPKDMPNCRGCIFCFDECFITPRCEPWSRTDKKNIIYKEIKGD